MHGWNSDELRKIVDADDLHVSPFREDRTTYGTPTWIWSVAVDGALYVRGYNGQDFTVVPGRCAAEGWADPRRRAHQGSDVRTGRRVGLGCDRRGLSREVSRQSVSRTDDRGARPVRDP